MSIPVDKGDTRFFHFKTAPLREGQGSLECVHQAMAPQYQEHQLSCWGVMEHRLTVQGTDEVYARTKQQMEIAEKLRKESRTQPIVLQGRPKVKNLQPMERISPVPASFRKPNRPKPLPPSFPKTTTASRATLLQSKPQHTPLVSSDSKPKLSSRSTYSLKDRVIHMLALKPQSREHIVNKLKKATKRSETAMSNLDSILQEVSDNSQGFYRLKSQYLKSLEVDQWPFYTDAQKQMLKRSKCLGGIVEAVSTVHEGGAKRPDNDKSCETVSKKPKLELEERLASTKPTTHSLSHLKPVEVPQPPSVQYDVEEGGVGSNGDSTHHPAKMKVKKKKKKKREELEVVTTDPTSTTSMPDHLSQFPTLTCEEERQRYKQIFNKEYVDYLKLKDCMDQVADQNQRECSALSQRLDSVAKDSEEYKEVKKLIQDKYMEFHRNRSYLENKNKFDELHQKLNHIKQMVLQYDAKHRFAN